MEGQLVEDRVIVKMRDAVQRLASRGFGSERGGVLELSLMEALFLVERGTLQVWSGKRRLGIEDIMEKALDREDFLRRYRVYADLRRRGYVVKTGFKFGAHFRLYERGSFSKDAHSTYLVHVHPEDAELGFSELSRSVRLALSVKKKLLYAVVDSEGDITYYVLDRFLP